jgi:hypothetical protein
MKPGVIGKQNDAHKRLEHTRRAHRIITNRPIVPQGLASLDALKKPGMLHIGEDADFIEYHVAIYLVNSID